MTRVTPLARAVKPDAVLVRELAGELVLLNLDTESYFGLDEVGARIWTALLAAESIDAACLALQQEYEVTPEELREDVTNLVDQLSKAKLLDVVAA